MSRYGFQDFEWEAAKAEAKAVLGEYAKNRDMIPYSELVTFIHSIQLQAHDPRLGHLLGEISAEETLAGRGMLSALVVHKSGDMKPGPGFFELARNLGHNTSDIDKFWIDEIKRVFTAWSTPHRRQG